jgi:hypothetical protein
MNHLVAAVCRQYCIQYCVKITVGHVLKVNIVVQDTIQVPDGEWMR